MGTAWIEETKIAVAGARLSGSMFGMQHDIELVSL